MTGPTGPCENAAAERLVRFVMARLTEECDEVSHIIRCAYWPHGDEEEGNHFRCDCPARRRIAEVHAQRRIVRNYLVWSGVVGTTAEVVTEELGWTVRLLASVYADHPDYREEWKI